MKKRNKIMAAATVGASAAAIWAGVLVTSSAIASEPASDKANVTMLAADPDGDGAISCQFDGVDMPSFPGGSAVIVVSGSAAAIPEGSVEADAQVISGTGTIQDPDGVLEGSGTVVLEASGDLPVLTLGADSVRPGAPEECAALQPDTALTP